MTISHPRRAGSIANNPNTSDIRPRFPPCQVYRRWMASIQQPQTLDGAVVRSADLIVLNGAGFATWTTKTTLPRSRIVDTSAGFADAYIATETLTHSHGAEGEHSHTGTANYTWLDFAQATRQAETLAIALKRVLPDGATAIDGNLSALAADLAILDATAREVGKMADVPMIASHPRYQYLARAYGFELTYVEWDAREPAAEEQWQALEQQRTDTDARLFIWEAEPSPEDRDRMTALGLVSVVFPPLANRPETGDFMSVMQRAISDLRSAVNEASAG